MRSRIWARPSELRRLGSSGRASDPAVAAVRAPTLCSRGPSEQAFTAMITLPHAAEQGATYTVRIDALPSGRIAHFGLNHIHDMATDYVVPSGAKYVPGSARIVLETGTPNVVAGGARLVRRRAHQVGPDRSRRFGVELYAPQYRVSARGRGADRRIARASVFLRISGDGERHRGRRHRDDLRAGPEALPARRNARHGADIALDLGANRCPSRSTPPGGSARPCTRSIRARSPTRTATGWATFAASSASSTTFARSA